jgi:hypothetical protein
MWIWNKEKSKWPPEVKDGRIKTSTFEELAGLSGGLEPPLVTKSYSSRSGSKSKSVFESAKSLDPDQELIYWYLG